MAKKDKVCTGIPKCQCGHHGKQSLPKPTRLETNALLMEQLLLVRRELSSLPFGTKYYPTDMTLLALAFQRVHELIDEYGDTKGLFSYSSCLILRRMKDIESFVLLVMSRGDMSCQYIVLNQILQCITKCISILEGMEKIEKGR